MDVKMENDVSNDEQEILSMDELMISDTTVVSDSTSGTENGLFCSIENAGQFSGNGRDRKLRVSPLTVKWLVENYETASGVSLPRSVLYLHYMQHCAEQNLDPVNAASFGKLIRSVFLGLRTRRLGTRGNSKYHYYGIRIKKDMKLDESTLNSYMQKYANEELMASTSSCTTKNGAIKVFKSLLRIDAQVIPKFPDIIIDDKSFTTDDIFVFKLMYMRLLEASLLAIRNLDFVAFNGLWKDFWNTSELLSLDEKRPTLPRAKLIHLASKKPVLDFITYVDTSFYLNIIHKFLPEVLNFMPIRLNSLMNNFANNIESWMITSLTNCSEDLKQRKICAVIVFKESFLRYLYLNRISQSTTHMLESQKIVVQMVADYNRIDFEAIKRESMWLLNMNVNIINTFQQDFAQAFKNRLTIEQWASWLNALFKKMTENEMMTVSEFILRWSFFWSEIIRELILGVSPSFGCFILLQKFFDLYYTFYVEKITHIH